MYKSFLKTNNYIVYINELKKTSMTKQKIYIYNMEEKEGVYVVKQERNLLML